MSSNRWDPFKDFVNLREAMNSLLEESLARPRPGTLMLNNTVPLDVIDAPDAYVLILPLPGLRASDVEISVLGNNVRISGEIKDRELLQPEGARWLIRERQYGPFDRSVTLPMALNSEQASAEFEDGVLRVHIPKADGARPKTIPVKTGNAD